MVDYSPGDKPRILYVDDEADNLQTFRALFRREYDIRVAESAKDALEMLRREQIDVLISDQRMPGMTGVELLEQAAAEFPDTLRFMLTGFSDFDPLVDAINQGRIQGYFTKPLNPDEIKGRIQKGLETLYLRASNEQLLEELKQNQDFLNAVIDNTPDMIIVSDANNSRLIMVNRAGDELLGHSHEELLGRRIHELFPKQEESLPGKEREFLNGKVLCDIPRETIQTRHKGERVLHTRKIPIPDDRGVPKYVLSISEDITEQKQTEEALLESEKQYRNIIENAIEGIFQTTPEGGYRTINPAFAHMFGYDSPGEMMTAVPNIEEHLYVRPEDRKRLIAILSGSEGRVRGFEVQLRRRDGSPLWVSMNARLVRNGEGNPLFLEGTCVDISERKLAEDALRKSEALLNQVGQIAKIGGWEMDLITRKANWTRETYDIVEIEPGEPIPGPDEHVSYYLPEYRPLVAEAMRALIEEDKPLDFEAQLLTTKGNVKWCHAIGMAVCEGGECIKVHGTFQDVTQRKRMEEALCESEDKFKYVFEHSSIGKSITFPSGEIHVNRAFCEMLGFSEEELRHRTWQEITHPDDIAATQELIAPILAGVMDSGRITKRYLHKNGSTVWADISTSLRRDSAGHPLYFITSAMDISEHKQAEEEKDRLEARLSQAQKMEAVGTLAGGIAHDFNNILGIILGYTEIAGFHLAPDSPARQSLDEVIKATHRAKDLVGQILTFSRKSDQEKRPLQLIPIVKETLKLLRSTLPTTIEIRQEIDLAQGDDVVMADATQMHQVLMNLATNSAHAMQDQGGVFRIAVSPIHFSPIDPAKPPEINPGSYLRMTVEDTGVGMDHTTIERIFDPYFTTKKLGEGTGLGLAVVHGIIKGHSGAITVYSEPGKGTVFHIYLPRLEIGEVSKAPSPGAIVGGREKILLVDDEEQLVNVVKGSLELLGYEVTATTRSPEALDLFARQPHYFDLLITDYTMPKMTGIDLAEKIMEIRSDIPIILCTGFSERINEDSVKKTGIRAFTMKPVSLEGIATLIRKVLDAVD